MLIFAVWAFARPVMTINTRNRSIVFGITVRMAPSIKLIFVRIARSLRCGTITATATTRRRRIASLVPHFHRHGMGPRAGGALTTSQEIEIAEVIAGRGNDDRLADGLCNGKTIRSRQFALRRRAVERRR